jgi:indolepyruvate ferredoxin oxidoreductase, beta subunit
MKTTGILIAGVGGQGILLAGDILCRVAMTAGFDVKKSEVHGMAQRGGCVTSHVRYGTKVYSPLAKKHDVDILISFEKMESLRYLDYLKDSQSIVIINTEEVNPPSVNIGDAHYPVDIINTVRSFFKTVKPVDALALAHRAGSNRTANTVLLGTLSFFLPMGEDIWEKILCETFPPNLLSSNLEAFRLGRSVCKAC